MIYALLEKYFNVISIQKWIFVFN